MYASVRERQTHTNSRVVRLIINDEIEKDPRLNESQIAEPLIIKDNSFVFIDKGVLRIVDSDLTEQYQKVLIKISQRDSSRFHSTIQLSTDGLISVNIYERSKEPPIEYMNNYWLISLKY